MSTGRAARRYVMWRDSAGRFAVGLTRVIKTVYRIVIRCFPIGRYFELNGAPRLCEITATPTAKRSIEETMRPLYLAVF